MCCLWVLEDVCQNFGHLDRVFLGRRYLWSTLCSLLSWCRKWRCTGTATSECSGKQEATTGKGLCGNLLYSSCHQLKGLSHLIHITAERYSSYQQYYYHGSYYKGCRRNWPREPVTCFYYRWSSIQEGVIHGTQWGHLRDESPGFCTVPLSLFADPEQILRRLYLFAEEPCKSTTTTSEPCSQVFKEVQPRPSKHSNLEYHINNLNLYLHVFGLLIIYYCNKKYPTGL